MHVGFERSEIDGTVPARFQKVVEQCALRPAIDTGDRIITYRELDLQSSRLAQVILRAAVGRSAPVPLLFGHDPRALIALLAVLKTGLPYSLLDPTNPTERSLAIVRELGTKLLVHSDETSEQARKLTAGGIILVDIDDVSDVEDPAPMPDITVSPDDLAYVVFTSGTTGIPKGVTQNHRNVLHRAWLYGTTANLSQDDRLVLLYSPSASGAVRDIFGSLLNGCTLYPYDLRKLGLDRLGAWLQDNRITVYNSVATVFRHFAATLSGADNCPDLRLLQLGSETIYSSDVALYKRLFSDACRFVARLGSSEISPICKYYVDKQTEIKYPTVPAGFPTLDVEVQILDEDGHLLEADAVGEIVVRSRYLTPGYWNQPHQTAEVLHVESDGTLVFRTGDLGKLTQDGCLLHLGRKDFQVKIDGHRVETSEVESALLDLNEIKEAAVIAQMEPSGGNRLVAYVVPTTRSAPTADSLRFSLSDTLPPHMMPSVFALIDRLPVTSSGKVDRRRLPQIERLRPAMGKEYVEPRTEVESTLADIWSDVTGIEKVGVFDSLMDLGGSSLQAMRITSRINKLFDIDIPLASVLELENVARVAELVGAMQAVISTADSPQSDEREQGVL